MSEFKSPYKRQRRDRRSDDEATLREFPLPERGYLQIAIISDTHSEAHPNALSLVADLSPDLIFHAGDIGNMDVLKPFERIAPLVHVRGNIDGQSVAPNIARVRVRGVDSQGEGYELGILMTHIALYGPRLRRDAKELVARYRPQLFVCGHSHVPFIGQEAGTLVFNPGSIGPPRRPLPICFGAMELGPGHTVLRHIDCETGEPWSP